MSNNLNAVDSIPENAVRDPSGKIIIFDCIGNAIRCISLVFEHTGYKLEDVRVATDCYAMIPDPDIRQHVLSVPERSAVAALAWHCREYGAGLKLGESYIIPIAGASDDLDGGFEDESRAYQFAQVIETTFEVSAQIISTPYGWSVVAGSHDCPISGEMLAQLRGACRVLMDYPVGEYSNVFNGNAGSEIHSDAEARRTWHERTNAQASRIESKLDALLSRLDAHVDPRRDTKAAKDKPAAVDVFAEEDKDPHTLPAKAKSKSRK